MEVDFKGKKRTYEAELRVFGYTYKIAMMIDDTEVLFEPDEERNYRAVIPYEALPKKLDHELLKAIADELEANLK